MHISPVGLVPDLIPNLVPNLALDLVPEPPPNLTLPSFNPVSIFRAQFSSNRWEIIENDSKPTS